MHCNNIWKTECIKDHRLLCIYRLPRQSCVVLAGSRDWSRMDDVRDISGINIQLSRKYREEQHSNEDEPDGRQDSNCTSLYTSIIIIYNLLFNNTPYNITSVIYLHYCILIQLCVVSNKYTNHNVRFKYTHHKVRLNVEIVIHTLHTIQETRLMSTKCK